MPLGDAASEEVFGLLQAKRAEWEVDAPRKGNDFQSSLLGGAWLHAHRGRAYDAFKGEARAAAAKKWCVSHGLAQSARYDVTVYGEAGASVLSLAWVHRVQFLYSCFAEGGEGPDVDYRRAVLEAYREPPDFTALAAGLTGRAQQRALSLRDMWPNTATASAGYART